MNYWLIKSEPNKYSWYQFVKDKKTSWDGVRNYMARNNLKSMRKGDYALFYHSNIGMEVVGIAEVIKTFYQDPTTNDQNWVAVDFKPVQKLKKPVNLKVIKEDDLLKQMQFIKLSRLSVSSVTKEEFNRIMELGNS